MTITKIQRAALAHGTASRAEFASVLLDSVHEAIVAVDLDLRITYWNVGAEQIFGHKMKDAVGELAVDMIFDGDQEAGRSLDKELHKIKQDGQWQGQVELRHSDGNALTVDVAVTPIRDAIGQLTGYISLYRDISAERDGEQQVRFQAQILDSVQEAVVALDLDSNVSFWGKGAEKMFGYSSEDAIGRPLLELAEPPDGEGAHGLQKIWDHTRDGSTWNGRVKSARKDGSVFLADVAAAPIFDDVNKIVGLAGIHRDVTQLLEKEALIEESRQQMRNLVARLIDVREEERSAIAREIHDVLGQTLTRLKMDLHWLTMQLPEHLPRDRVKSIESYVDTMLDSVRQICFRLGPPILEDFGLAAAIEWQAQQFSTWSKWNCDLDLKLDKLRPNRDRDLAVFRIAQEALTNIARHARATRIIVRGTVSQGSLMVEIEDNGIGISPEAMGRPYSLGLSGMRERAANVGGNLVTASLSGGGTAVRVQVPVRAPQKAEKSS